MADFIVRIRVADADLADFAKPEELDLSLDARLSEVYDDNGDPFPFHVVKDSLVRVAEEGDVI